MDFPEDWVRGLKSVKGHPFAKQSNPTLYRAELNIGGTPEDTFLRFDGFKKGIGFRQWNKHWKILGYRTTKDTVFTCNLLEARTK